MPVKTALWRITNEGLTEARKASLEREADLHKWIEDDPALLGHDLLIVGSEVQTDGGRLDLLGLDSEGVLHVIELKRDRTPRDVVGQSLDYASWAARLQSDDVVRIYERYKSRDLAEAFRNAAPGNVCKRT